MSLIFQDNYPMILLLQFISGHNSEISFLISGLDKQKWNDASLAFISGVGNQNPSTGCGIRAF